MAGYIAATLYRGVDFIQIPTTLLSQIDSSVGGKVAVNSENAKNAIGTIYPPKLVLIDSATLNTLSDRQYNSGIAEMLKYGLIGSREIYQKVKDLQVKENIDESALSLVKTIGARQSFATDVKNLIPVENTYDSTTNELTVMAMDEDDEGAYYCEVSNPVLVKSDSASLTLISLFSSFN